MYLVTYLAWGASISQDITGCLQIPCLHHVPHAWIHSVLFDHFILKHSFEVGAK